MEIQKNKKTAAEPYLQSVRDREETLQSNTKELLSEIHRNLVMGSENLTGILSHVKNKFLLREITYQLEEYAAHTRKAAAMMARYQVTPYKSSPLKQWMAKGGIALNTLFDSSDEHIAEMIVRGTDMGAG